MIYTARIAYNSGLRLFSHLLNFFVECVPLNPMGLATRVTVTHTHNDTHDWMDARNHANVSPSALRFTFAITDSLHAIQPHWGQDWDIVCNEREEKKCHRETRIKNRYMFRLPGTNWKSPSALICDIYVQHSTHNYYVVLRKSNKVALFDTKMCWYTANS